MRKLLLTVTMILVSTAVAFSQGRDDHDDLGPILVGYGVVTPVSATSAGMVVFETFGLRRTAETTQAGVLPASLTTNAIMIVSTSGRLSRNLGVALVNPNAVSANVTLTLRRDDGTLVATTSLSIAALNQSSKFVTELFAQSAIPAEMLGTLTITSTAPIAAVGLRFRGINFSTIPVTNLATASPVPTIAAGVGGAGAVLLPQFAGGGGWATQVVVANTGTTSLTVRIDLFRQDGTPLRTGMNGTTASSFTNIVIPAGGVFSLAPRNVFGDDDF